MTDRKRLALLAATGSLALLLGAWAFQFAGYAPCKLCLWQRWPHGAAVAFGGFAFATGSTLAVLGGLAAALTTSGIGLYHAGVERGWWQGPDTCTSGPVGGLSVDELMAQIQSAPLIQCDAIAWQWLGVSMAGWNAILSFGLALVWAAALARGRFSGA